MIKIVTSLEMREMDSYTIDKLGIPGMVLMEKAGEGTVEVIKECIANSIDPMVYIFCGKGNNGGDGFVVARHLWDSGVQVITFIIGKEEDLKGDAKINFNIMKRLGLEYHFISSAEGLKKYCNKSPDLIVDALLGTGITGAVHGFMKNVIQYINDLNCTVVSIDVPSGLNTDIPTVEGEAVMANITVTIALPKRCHIFYPAKKYVGDLHIADIGIPQKVKNNSNVKIQLIERSDVKLPERYPDTHKYNCGKVAVLAGSPGYTGAAALTAEAALRIGAGLVILGIPGILNQIMEIKLTEVITRPYHMGKSGHLTSIDEPEIKDLLDWCDVLAIGPGLGRLPETQNSIVQILSEFVKPTVIDADALFALAQFPNLLNSPHPHWILTPHHGEFLRLNKNINKSVFQKEFIKLAQEFAERHEVILLLKGAPSLVASPNGEIYVNSTGNSGLASGGTGDVLTGFIAGLIAQDLDILNAGITANYLHGLCADEIIQRETEYTLIAGDLIDHIGQVIKKHLC